jgi:hypothetical protein
MHPIRSAVFLLLVVISCRPQEPLVLKQIKYVELDLGERAVLRARAVIHNPNPVRVRLRKADIEVWVNGQHSATLKQEFNQLIPAQDDFTLPLEVLLNLQQLGLIDAVLSVLGGKKFQVEYRGTLSLTYKGVRITLPVQHREEIRIRL